MSKANVGDGLEHPFLDAALNEAGDGAGRKLSDERSSRGHLHVVAKFLILQEADGLDDGLDREHLENLPR